MSEQEPTPEYIDRVKEHQLHLRDALHANAESRDRTIIALSGGALVLSVTFLSDLGQHLEWRWALIAAWVFLTISVASVALSYWTGDKTIRSQIAAINSWMADVDRDTDGPHTASSLLNRSFNTVALVALVAGLALLAVFAAANLV